MLYWKHPDGASNFSPEPRKADDGRDFLPVYEEEEADFAEGRLCTGGQVDDLVQELQARGAEPVLLDDWRAIDAAEVALGATRGRARTTLHEREALLAAVRAAASAD